MDAYSFCRYLGEGYWSGFVDFVVAVKAEGRLGNLQILGRAWQCEMPRASGAEALGPARNSLVHPNPDRTSPPLANRSRAEGQVRVCSPAKLPLSFTYMYVYNETK